MKVLLISAYLGRKGRELPSFPLGPAYLLGNLKGHECSLFDPNMAEHPFLETRRTIEKADPDVIALSLRNIDTTQSWDLFSYFQQFVATLRFVKEISPEARIVVGGTAFSMFPREIMDRLPEIDYGVFLEGEYTFPELLENIGHPERVKGLYFRNDGELFFTGRREPVDFNRLEAPPKEFPDLDLQKYKELTFSIGVQTKRGCAFRCAYCIYPFLQGRKVRQRSPRSVVDEIEDLQNSHDVKDFFFVDTVFNYPLGHAREICREMIRRKIEISWTAWFREDLINKRFMIEARNAGCHLFEFSPDGGSQEALDTLQKDTRINHVTETFEMVREVENVRVVYNFMYNVPGETSKTVADFYRLLFKMAAKCWKELEYVGLTNIRIYPNTRMHEIAMEQGIITKETNLLAPTFYNPPPFNTAYMPMKWARAPLHEFFRVSQGIRNL